MEDSDQSLDINKMAAEVAVKTTVELFKACLKGFGNADKWFKEKNKKYDFFGTAAQRYARQVENRYNEMRIFGMNKPVPLRSIYVRVNILEKIQSRQRISIDELQQYFDRDQRGFGAINQEARGGLEVVNQLQRFIVLGKPGAGKTTFLKYVTLQALDGNLKTQRIPVFVRLKDFADSYKTLIAFIIEQFDICSLPKAKPFIKRVLRAGKCLLLLDGLDEVSRDREEDVIKQVRIFSEKYSDNQFIISCRIAAYNYWFEKFTDVEIADFNDEQIQGFINNWFCSDKNTVALCWQKLVENKPIKELAASPLLLTMLCLVFDETMDFPENRAELYKEAIDALLKKWDASRRIQRAPIYRHLSLKRKESLFSRIAAETFEKNEYFFPQRRLEKYITKFIQHLPEANEDTIEPDSEAILKAIEEQHGMFVQQAKGIFSFSHLTFQEYFTANYIVENVAEGTLQRLIEKHLLDDKWQEVFILTASMLDSAETFLLQIKEKVDALAASKKMRDLLTPIQNEFVKKEPSYTPGATRALALYYILDLGPARVSTYMLASDLARNLGPALVSIYAFDRDLARDINPTPHDRGLQEYLKANRLLVACLKAECYVSKATRQKIFDELLMAPVP